MSRPRLLALLLLLVVTCHCFARRLQRDETADNSEPPQVPQEQAQAVQFTVNADGSVAPVAAAPVEATETPPAELDYLVPVKSEAQLTRMIATHQLVALFFHAPSCEFCPEILTMLNEASRSYVGPYITVGHVDVEELPSVAHQFSVEQTPQMLAVLHWNASFIVRFQFRWTQSELQSFLYTYSRIPSSYIAPLTTTTVSKLVNPGTVAWIADCEPTGATMCSDIVAALNEVAHELAGTQAKVAWLEETRFRAQFFPEGGPMPRLAFVSGMVPIFHATLVDPLTMAHRLIMELIPNGVVRSVTSSEGLKELLEERGSMVLLFLDGKSEYEDFIRKAFEIVAFQNQYITRFGIVSDPTLLHHARSPRFPVFQLWRDFSPLPLTFDDEEPSTWILTRWIRDNAFPPLIEFDPRLYRGLAQRGVPIAYLICNPQLHEGEFVTFRFGALAHKLLGKYTFLRADVSVYPQFTQHLNLSASDLPAVLVEITDTSLITADNQALLGRMYLHPRAHNMTTAELETLLNNVRDGVLRPNLVAPQ
eukprot:TRINITY_DN21438_c0_g1_i1.p1 TRINITY_DN21438_c0_g1~~TRINITY_DN21438_c0_g1_i1.p1  ORF type:complete len:542 (-),score=76.25 TRINITY_DN21438_c0_g1_i1:9-1613(-)